MSRPDRETSRTRPFSIKARARTPSHYISTAHWASWPPGGEPGVASMGASDAGSGDQPEWIIHPSGTHFGPRPTPG